MPYIYKQRFIDTQIDTRREVDIFNIAHTDVFVNTDGNITIKEWEFRDFEVNLELLTCIKVNRKHLNSDDLRTYRKILLMTNA